MYHRFGIITDSDVISSRKLTNSLNLVRICLDEVLGGLGGPSLLVSLTAQFNWTIPSFDEEGRPSMAGQGLSATYDLVWKCFEH